MIVLGIESTAHTFGIAIFDGKKVRSNIKDVYKTLQGGLIPREMANHHIEVCYELLERALKESELKLKDIDVVSYSASPGIGHSLRIGLLFAKIISEKIKVPLVPVNHCIAHLEVGKYFSEFENPLLLYASGANTQIIAFNNGRYRVFGETLDTGIGNFLDSLGYLLGFGFPGGPKIYEESLKAQNFIKLPYSVKGMDVSFSGILTYIRTRLLNDPSVTKADICYSIQETVYSMLLEVTERAIAHTGIKELVLGGGVAMNKRLQEMSKKLCEDLNIKYFCPEGQYLMDNAGMIAILGYKMYKSGIKMDAKHAYMDPYERTDDVDVTWK
ncbi:MAG: KEOPS complex N(6)-L-threonylcarbamoyladenine synthase Kae1 [Candidatus Nanoarchaeia archaeon]|nr:KEOPS complex N(6)-L-threonylcarbamoyladenine synthase Kae1 [Candidatus Nanoarchaeia archaeon]